MVYKKITDIQELEKSLPLFEDFLIEAKRTEVLKFDKVKISWLLTLGSILAIGMYNKKKLVGVIIGERGSDIFFGDENYTKTIAIYVKPEFRKTIRAGKLLKEFENYAKENGSDYIDWQIPTDPNNPITQSFKNLTKYKDVSKTLRKYL